MLRWRCAGALYVAGIIVLTPWRAMTAQASGPGNQEVPSHAPRVDSLATITTDTGALAPGHRDLTRYTTPVQCLAAVQMAQDASERTLAAQATAARLRIVPTEDTLPAEVVRVAQRCLARLPLDRIAGPDLATVFTLALAAQRDSLAHGILRRQLSAATTDSVRMQDMVNAIAVYLAASPPRVIAAESLVTLAPSGTGAQETASADRVSLWLQLHMQLLTFWRMGSDTAHAHAEATGIVDFIRQHELVVSSSIGQEALINAYQALITLAYLEHPEQPDSSLFALARAAKEDWRHLRSDTIAGGAGASRAGGRKQRVMPVAWLMIHQTDSLPAILQKLSPEGLVVPTVLGHNALPSPQIHAEYWFPVGADTLAVKPGVVSLEYDIPPICLTTYGPPLYLKRLCADPMTQLQAWQQQYGTRGLQITVVASLHGHALFSGIEAPTDEARSIAWYVRDYWHLPARVAVRSGDDAREGDEPCRVVLTDQHGHVVYARTSQYGDFVAGVFGPLIGDLLDHAMSSTSTTTAPAGSSPVSSAALAHP